MITKGGGDGSGFTPRNNPYAGPHELKLKQILKTNFGNLSDTEKSWSEGAKDLADLNERLSKQKDRIGVDYQSTGGTDNPGAEAAKTYERLIAIVEARRVEMTEVSAAIKKARGASSTAWTEYNSLPIVEDPAAANPTAGITGHSKAAIKERTKALNDAQKDNDIHNNSVNAAEAKARQVLSTLDSEMEQATDKMRKVAGMEKPGSVTNASTAADVNPSSGEATKSNPGVVRQPQLTPTSPVNQPTHNSVVNTGTPTQVVNTGTPTQVANPTILPTEQPTSHNTGVLQSAPTVTNSTPTTAIGPTSPTASASSPVTANPVVTPGLSASAVSRTSATAVPGSTAARSAGIGRSSSTAAANRGVLGRNTMMPGQSAAGRSGTTAGRGARGMMPGQSGAKGSRAGAGSRGSRGGRMMPGTGGARGKGKNSDRKGESVDLLWDDGQEWLGDDETGPQVLS